jgi:hypothetical protein
VNVIQTRAEIGEDRVLRLTLPADTPIGDVDVLVVLEPASKPVDLEARRKAAEAGAGILRDLIPSTDDFLAERHEDDRRRDKALGLNQ